MLEDRRMAELSALFSLLLMEVAITSGASNVQIVDLTHDLGPDTLYWPGNPSFQLTIIARNTTSAGYWYESNSFFTPEHGGTHLDSPSHFAEGAWRVHQIPADRLMGPAVVVDVKDKAAQDADYLLSVQDLEDWEKAHGKMPAKSVVFMYSGWGSRYPNASLVFNTPSPTEPSTFHFPGIHPDAATFLSTQRDVIAVGVDTPSTDYGQSSTFQTHVILGEHNILGLENVANLDRLPARGATVVIGVIKLVDGSGAPARLLALVGDGADIFGSDTGSGRRHAVSGLLLFWGVLYSWLSLK